MIKKSLSIGYLLLLLTLNAVSQQLHVLPQNKDLKYMGRISHSPDIAELYWSGSSVKMNFEGTAVKAVLKDERANNYLNVIIDNDSIYKIKLDSVKKEYSLAEHLPNGKHSIELVKITEYDRGKTGFYGFELNKEGKILDAPAPRKRKMEFYGNSITCGYAVEDATGDSPASPFENHYLSYAAITARHFDADYNCIAKSGIGITISWFPYTMSTVFDRLNPDDSSSKWDFKNYTPDIVVINLFQNDSWLVNMPEHPEFKRLFGSKKPSEDFIIDSYTRFVKTIREKYPHSDIICALGNMDATKEGSPWPGYVVKAVKSLNDKRIYTHFFPYKNTPGHPKVTEQQAMAQDLIEFIEQNFHWN
ncbi:SGNH/GDSL hydrolase family protein [Rubrolithibacter danxiaensis]|uniref:SGNH/GDSL hydrolase family protein n=1 Tax=Rubrolithibacter danxiaensis TaxID=3390805 RepID=UPI003BF8B471